MAVSSRFCLLAVFVAHCRAASLHKTSTDAKADVPKADAKADVPKAAAAPVAKPLTADQMTAMHKHIDEDADGKASMSEFMQFSHHTTKSVAKKASSDLVKKMDLDKDGKISLDDILGDEVFTSMDASNPAVESHMFHEGQKFMAADTNGDKFLDEHEVGGFFFPQTHDGVQDIMASRFVERADKDGDGVVSGGEFEKLGSGRKGVWAHTKETFQHLDTNGDGKLDANEVKPWESGVFHTEKAMKELFKAADKDGDSHLSSSELQEARAQIAATEAHPHLEKWAKHHGMGEL